MGSVKHLLASLANGLPLDPLPGPAAPVLNYNRDASVPHAPIRVHGLTVQQKRVRNQALLSDAHYYR